jgi:hypothetical protein
MQLRRDDRIDAFAVAIRSAAACAAVRVCGLRRFFAEGKR